jgi:hypothetical protein
MLWCLIEHATLTTEANQLIWKWNASGVYTQLWLIGLLPRLNSLPILETNLEKLGTTTCQILPLVHQF